ADDTGTAIGRVQAIENFGASDILDIALDAGGSVMVPFVADVVREDGKRLIVDRAWLI
ncbi:PRC-barrel domain-containing protein, partial [Sandarakinorhabdus sp.]|uniref:PRC-barrel domain-containing protein n=1 Tax=Sandarakinorhabdus sp. TaxID=1916663 RepID=UPI00333F054B